MIVAQFHLTVVTPEGSRFDGQADSVKVRTTTGDVMILPHHIDYCASLGKGEAKITADGGPKLADIEGGMMYVSGDEVQILSNRFDWKE